MSAATTKRKPPGWLLALLIVFSPIILVVVVVVLALFIITSICLHVLIWIFWCIRGRDILFVYSDSPIWHDYVEQRLLPPIRDRAVILNWSERKHWRFLLARLAFYPFRRVCEVEPLGSGLPAFFLAPI